MTKSELIQSLADEQQHLAYKDVELAVRCILDHMGDSLSNGERIEIRGFGSFSLHYRPPRTGRARQQSPTRRRSRPPPPG